MRIYGFEWDIDNIEHISRHGVQDYEAEEVISNTNKKTTFSKSRNDTYAAFGITEDGRYLFVVFLVKEKRIIRVITTRNMTEKEKHNYKKRVR